MSPDRLQPLPGTEKGPGYFAVQWRWTGTTVAVLGLAWVSICLAAYYLPGNLPFFSFDRWVRVWPPLLDMVLHTWARHLPPLAWFFGFVVGASVVGRSVVGYFTKALPLNMLERWAFSYGLGIGIWGFLMFALSLAGLLRPAQIHLVVAAVVGACWWRGRNGSIGEDLPTAQLWKGGALPLGVFTVGTLLLIGAAALSPEIWYDSLVYHLALPALYILEGAMVPTPTLVYSGIPMHMEMLYLWALSGGGPITAKLIHWSLGVGVSLAMLGFFVRRGTPWAGWLACILFFSMPMAGGNYSRTFVEGGSVFFILLAALALTLFVERPNSATNPQRILVLAALFLGIALSTKYTNGPVLAAFLVALAMSPGISRQNVAVFGSVAAACVAPWLIKNALFYHNPVFPFFHDWWFPATTTPVNWRGLHADAGGRAWGSLLAGGGRPLWEALASPVLLSLKATNYEDYIGILPLAFLPAVWALKPVSEGARLWIRIFLGAALAWFLTTSMPRMFMPGLALLAVIEGVALARVSTRWLRWALGLAVLLVSVSNLFVMTLAMSRTGMYSYLAGATDTAAFLRVSHITYPAPDYASREWINQQTPLSARVLVVGDARGLYLERPFQTASVFDTDPFWLAVDESASADELYQHLTKKGFSHLLVNIAEIVRLRRGSPTKKQGSLEVAEAFFRTRTQVCFGEKVTTPGDLRWSLVYALVPSTEEASGNALLVDMYRALEGEKLPSAGYPPAAGLP